MKTFSPYGRALSSWSIVLSVTVSTAFIFSHLHLPTVVVRRGHRAEQLPPSENMGNYVAESINKLLEMLGFAQIFCFICLCEDFQAEAAVSRVGSALWIYFFYIPVYVRVCYV